MNVAANLISYELALIVLAAAGLVHLAGRLQQPSVVAYLAAGIALGPAALGLVSESALPAVASELGLAFLLFFIGMEIEFAEIREIAGEVAAVTGLQLAAVGLTGFFVALLLEFPLVEAAVLGVAFSFSSTAVVVKLLSDREELSSLHGKIDTGVLLVQDLAVVVALALISSGSGGTSLASALGGMAAMALVVAPLAVYAGRNFLDTWLRNVASSEHMFLIHGLAWLFLMVELSLFLGASVEIGAFVAGLAIGQLPYSSDLEHSVKPLTDLFMALFFVEVGLGLSSSALSVLNEAVIAALILVPAKFAALFVLIDRFKFTPETSFRSSITMVQVSEFALVLAAAASASGLIGGRAVELVTMTSVLTIALSTYLIQGSDSLDRALRPFLNVLSTEGGREPELEELSGHVLVVGFDEVGRAVAEAAEGREVVVVDRNVENVDELSQSSFEFIYGDMRYREVRQSARLDQAELVFCSANGHRLNRTVVEEADGAVTFVTANSEEKAADLYDLGAHYVLMDDVESAEQLAELVEKYFGDRQQFEAQVAQINHRLAWGDRESS